MRRHSDSSESHSDSYTEVISMESFARGHMWFSLFFLSSSFTLGSRTREISTTHWNPKLWLVLGISVNFESLSSLKRSSAFWRECWGLVCILQRAVNSADLVSTVLASSISWLRSYLGVWKPQPYSGTPFSLIFVGHSSLSTALPG